MQILPSFCSSHSNLKLINIFPFFFCGKKFSIEWFSYETSLGTYVFHTHAYTDHIKYLSTIESGEIIWKIVANLYSIETTTFAEQSKKVATWIKHAYRIHCTCIVQFSRFSRNHNFQFSSKWYMVFISLSLDKLRTFQIELFVFHIIF